MDEKAPGLFRKLVNLAKATVRATATGFQRVSEETFQERLAICQACPFLKMKGHPAFGGEGVCGKCGCGVSNDDKAILNKLVWASEYCPEGKWGAPPPEPPKPAWPEEMPKDFKLIAGGSGACACCPIVTSCCPNDALPQTLTLTVTGSVDCAGTYTLTYSSVNNDWEYAGVIGSCNL